MRSPFTRTQAYPETHKRSIRDTPAVHFGYFWNAGSRITTLICVRVFILSRYNNNLGPSYCFLKTFGIDLEKKKELTWSTKQTFDKYTHICMK